jgi:hypothetical protein
VPTRTDIALVDAGGRLTVINTTGADPGRTVLGQVWRTSLDGVAVGDVVVLAGSTPDGIRLRVVASLGANDAVTAGIRIALASGETARGIRPGHSHGRLDA